MKEKVITIIACLFVILAIIPSPTIQVEAATNTNQLVTDAQNAGTILKWAISIEGSADFKTRPYNQYNVAKRAIGEAENAAAKLSTSEKLIIQAKLIEPKIQVKRAQAYIDAITSSEKIVDLASNLQKAIKSEDLAKVETAYHIATAEYKKQVKLLDRVYGQTTRDGIRNAVKPSMEKLIDQVKYDVTVKMYLDKASTYIKDNKLAEAAIEIEKADYYLALSDVDFTFRSQLEKCLTNTMISLPLQPISITSDGQNTVTVQFSKEYSIPLVGLEAGQFKVSNETVQASSLSEDKKSVILTTSDLDPSTNYMVTWKDHKIKFATEEVADTTGILLTETEVAYLETTNNRIYNANLTNADGSPYIGRVKITLSEVNPVTETTSTSAVITFANGVGSDAGQEWNAFTDQNGNLTFMIATTNLASVTHVQPTIQKLDGNQKSKNAAVTHFFQLQNISNVYSLDIIGPHIYLENDYIYTNGFKYKWDSNDLFFIRGRNVSQEVFETALSSGDTIVSHYEIIERNNSTWNIIADVTQASELVITNPVHSPVSYDGASYIISGTAQPGYSVHIYRNGTFLGLTKVDENGEWTYGSVSLIQNISNTFEAYLYAPGKYGQNGEESENPLSPATAIINVGAFASTEISLIDKEDNGLTISDTLDFSFTNPTFGNEFKKDLSGEITINDGYGKSAVVKVEYVDENTLKVVDFVAQESNFSYKSSSLVIIGVESIVNQDQLKFNIAASNPILKRTIN